MLAMIQTSFCAAALDMAKAGPLVKARLTA
jgi:hypothetical protein